MEMTKQRKMLIAVLCLGVGGLVLDRLVLGSPESATADDGEVILLEPQTASPAQKNTTQPVQEVTQADALPTYASLAQRLIQAQAQQANTTDDSEPLDPFRLPQQWQAEKVEPQVHKQGETRESAKPITDAFKLDGTVRSLIGGKEEIMAVVSGGGVDGRAIRVGQRVRIPISNGAHEEYELIEVGSRYVVWLSVRTQEKIVMHVDKVL